MFNIILSLDPAFNLLATSSLLPAKFGRKPVLAPKSAEMLGATTLPGQPVTT